jgi:methylmalonyl-CoA mutase N-terminal domain/subunit
MRLRFHCQTAAATLTRAQPRQRGAHRAQALSAVLGGQSFSPPGSTKPTIPSEEAMKRPCEPRVIAEESRVASVIDPR